MLNITDFRRSLSEQEHESRLRAAKRIKKILDGSEKYRGPANEKHIWQTDQLNRLLPELTLALNYEKLHSKGRGPATDLAVEVVPKLRTLSRSIRQGNNKSSYQFYLAISLLSSALPSGTITEPGLPVFYGSDSFCNVCSSVVKSLPRCVRQNISDIFVYEISRTRCMGICVRASDRLIGIAGDLTDNELKNVLGHEIAHVYLNHTSGGPEAEKAADDLCEEWGFKRQYDKNGL